MIRLYKNRSRNVKTSPALIQRMLSRAELTGAVKICLQYGSCCT